MTSSIQEALHHSTQSVEVQTIKLELTQLIVTALNLETPAQDIDPAAPLFHEGLGLDSIDMLEIALVVSQRYGCSLRSDNPDNVRTFASLNALAQYVASHRTK